MIGVPSDLPIGWEARWIWLGETGVLPNGERDPSFVDRFVLFRRSFELGDPPSRALLRAAADSRFVILVNGVEVGRGPVRADPRQMRCELLDVRPFLRRGQNVIGMLVRYYGVGTSWWVPAPSIPGDLGADLCGACLAAELRMDDLTIGTDERWRAHSGDAWTPATSLGGSDAFLRESVDARLLPVGWAEPGFDEDAWEAASVIPAARDSRPPSAPHGPLAPRPIPQLRGERRRPASVRVVEVPGGADDADSLAQIFADLEGVTGKAFAARDDAAEIKLDAQGVSLALIDFGQTVAGTLVVDLEAPAGTRIDWALGEDVDAAGLPVRDFVHHGLRYIARGNADHYESFDPMGGRYGIAAVRASGPVTLRLSVQERLFPRAPDSATFSCSDPLLEEIFRIGLRTVDLCSYDAYIDCPTREARAFTGDAVVHQSVHLATCDDWSLARWNPVMVDTPRPDGMVPTAAIANVGGAGSGVCIPDWGLHWIRSVHNLMRYTGDRELVASLLPDCERVLRWFLPFLQPDGLLAGVTDWVLIDWSNVPVRDTSAALNALWARGLRDFEELVLWIGDLARASWAHGLRDRVRDAFEIFWDEQRGLYRDQRVDGVLQLSVSRHTASAAVCAGIVPEHRLDRVAESIADRSVLAHSSPVGEAIKAGDIELALSYVRDGNPPPSWDVAQHVLEAQPFFRYVVHDALAEAGRADLVADACLDWRLFIDAGERTWPETWTGGTHCHAWSSTPTRDLIVYTLGISPATPGFDTARIAPRLGNLSWAEATVPIPAGRLRVRATPERIEIDSPVPILVDTGIAEIAESSGRHTLTV